MPFKTRGTTAPPPLPEVRADDRFAYPDEGNRSEFTAFLMGGIVVAGGLLAFLYYDSNGLDPGAGREPRPTGAVQRSDGLARLPSIDVGKPAPPRASAD